MFHKYPSIEGYHKVSRYLENYDVIVQEKLDGTNVSLFFNGATKDVELWGRNIPIDRSNPGMYKPFVEWFAPIEEYACRLFFRFEPRILILSGELVNTNKLRYASCPPIVLFDVREYEATTGQEMKIPRQTGALEAWKHWFIGLGGRGIEVAPTLYEGPFNEMPDVDSFIGPSFLDKDVTMEGVVLKAYDVDIPYVDEEGQPKLSHQRRLYAKYVRPDFQEVKAKVTSSDPLQRVVERFATEARLQKAIQRAKEDGADYEKNRGLLIRYAIEDIEKEEDLDAAIIAELGKPIRKSIGSALMKQYAEQHG